MSDCRNPNARWPTAEIMRHARHVDATGLIPFVDTETADRYLDQDRRCILLDLTVQLAIAADEQKQPFRESVAQRMTVEQIAQGRRFLTCYLNGTESEKIVSLRKDKACLPTNPGLAG